MDFDLRDRLQAALPPALSIVRELGGGGMSRVFLARDADLGRDVVIKVLHPEFGGGVSADRFKREIQLVAQLQHPHVVPIVSAGECDGLPFLVMPYVPGDALRERLAQGALPIAEALSILRDVARALDYAHSRGIIHRDIKPDNVLLSHGAATVTDFGVAKAASAARTQSGLDTLTSAGTSLGTPAYMAPEQVAGDSATDHRADLYSWGIMAYELIAGHPPFAGRTPQQLLAAHITETPAPLLSMRPDCPPALAAVVMQCLAKDATARPQSATEVLAALETVSPREAADPDATRVTRSMSGRAIGAYVAASLVMPLVAYLAIATIGLPGWVLPGAVFLMALGLPVILLTALGVSPHLTWRRATIGGIAAVLIFAAVVVGYMTSRSLGIGPGASLFARGVMAEHDGVVVADFRSPADSTLGPVVSEGVRTSLAQSRAVTVVPAPRVAAVMRLMQLSPSARVTRSIAHQIAEREGAKAVLDGEVTALGASYLLTLRLHAVADSSELAVTQETAEDATDMIPAIDRATRRLRERMGESFRSVRAAPKLENVTTASLPALRKYTEGWKANTLEADWPRAIAALEEAVALDSTFAAAWRQLGVVYINAGIRPGRRDTALALAFRHRDRLAEPERSLVEGTYYTYGPGFNRPQALAAYARALAADSTHASALNATGLLHLEMRNPDQAVPIFERMRRLNPDNAFASTNLASAYAQVGREADAHRVLDEAARQFPSNENVLSWRRILWHGDTKRDSATAFCTALRGRSAVQTRRTAQLCLQHIALMEGRLGAARRGWRVIAAFDDSLGRRRSSVMVAAESLMVEAVVAGRDATMLPMLDRLVRQDTVAHTDGLEDPRLLLAELYAIAGRPDRARQLLAQSGTGVTNRSPVIDHHLRQVVEAEIAIAEGRFADAISAYGRADTLPDGAAQDCDVCVDPRLARAYDLAGQPQQAIAVYERYLASRYQWRRTWADGLYYASALRRLGELYQEQNDPDRATQYLARFVALWANADPELQPVVDDARRRLQRLQRPR